MMRSLRNAAVAIAVCWALLAPGSAVRADDAYEINAILPVTGSGALLGKEEQDALHTLELHVNADGGIGGRQIHFAVADDQSNPRTAVQLASALVARHVPIILGSSLSAQCGAIVPLVANGPVLYCFSPDIRPLEGSFVFSSSFSTRDVIVVSVRYLRLRGLTRVGIVTSTDTTGQEAERSIDAALALPENRAMHVVAREHVDPADLSAAAQMTRIKTSGAQVTIAWSTGTPLATLLRAANDVGLGMPVLTSNGNLTYSQMKQYGGFLPAEMLFPAGPSYAPDEITDKQTRAAVDAYLAEFSVQGIRPDYGQSLAWDPAQLLIGALKQIGSGATAAQLRTYISQQRTWTGINGAYNFRTVPQRGLGPSGVVIVRWDAANDTWDGVSKPGGVPLKE